MHEVLTTERTFLGVGDGDQWVGTIVLGDGHDVGPLGLLVEGDVLVG